MLPDFGTKDSACWDIRAFLDGDDPIVCYSPENRKYTKIPGDIYEGEIELSPKERCLVPTGLILDIPLEYSVRVHLRSSVGLKQGLILPNGEGIIDADYHNELFIMVTNNSNIKTFIKDGERIAQGELVKCLKYKIVDSEVPPSKEVERVGGFGSTGKD